MALTTAKAIRPLSALIEGGTVVCIASGPSLTTEDVETVRRWKGPGRAVIVANTTFRAAPWADAMYAMDKKWWNAYGAEVAATFHGLKFSGALSMQGVHRIQPHEMRAHGNSGAGCVSLAVMAGAKRVVLLGFDCQHTGGRAHWHPDHPGALGNAKTVDKWPPKFRALASSLRGRAEVVNASRETALDMFRRVPLDHAIGVECAAACLVE